MDALSNREVITARLQAGLAAIKPSKLTFKDCLMRLAIRGLTAILFMSCGVGSVLSTGQLIALIVRSRPDQQCIDLPAVVIRTTYKPLDSETAGAILRRDPPPDDDKPKQIFTFNRSVGHLHGWRFFVRHKKTLDCESRAFLANTEVFTGMFLDRTSSNNHHTKDK